MQFAILASKEREREVLWISVENVIFHQASSKNSSKCLGYPRYSLIS